MQSVRGPAEVARNKEAARGVALAEARVVRLLEVLGPVLADTKANIEKKQARTYEEMQAELNEADQVPIPPPFPHRNFHWVPLLGTGSLAQYLMSSGSSSIHSFAPTG